MNLHMNKIILAILLVLNINALQAADKPNVLIILADDLGYGDVQCNNPTRVKSKHPTLITLQHRVCALPMPILLPEFARLPATPFLQEDIIGAPGCNQALLACGGTTHRTQSGYHCKLGKTAWLSYRRNRQMASRLGLAHSRCNCCFVQRETHGRW